MAVVAWVTASVIACSIALLAATRTVIEDAVRPLAVILQVTPIVAIAPLVQHLEAWASERIRSAGVVALAVVVAFFPIFSGVLTGLKSTSTRTCRAAV